MSDESISPDVRRFIAEHIRSVVVLEVLLLLSAGAGRSFSAAQVSAELRVDVAWTERELAELERRGLVKRREGNPPSYAYEMDAATHPTIAALAEAYAQRRVSVISLIFAQPKGAIQSFANAFNLRKERHDG